jgi:hypothetical protein
MKKQKATIRIERMVAGLNLCAFLNSLAVRSYGDTIIRLLIIRIPMRMRIWLRRPKLVKVRDMRM